MMTMSEKENGETHISASSGVIATASGGGDRAAAHSTTTTVTAHSPSPSSLSSSIYVKRETFAAEEFNVKQWIADTRRYVPLDTLKQELNHHLSSLKNELIDYINRDYDDFLLLSSKLIDVDKSVVRMRQPLLSLRTKVENVMEIIEKEASELEESIDMRKKLMAARQIMEVLMDTAQVVSKVEKLVDEMHQSERSLLEADDSTKENGSNGRSSRENNFGSSGEVKNSGKDIEVVADKNIDFNNDLEILPELESRLKVAVGHGRLLERIATETARLKYLEKQGDGVRYISSLSPRIKAAESSLIQSLCRCFGSSLMEGGREDVVMHCLRGCAALIGGSSSAKVEISDDFVIIPSRDADADSTAGANQEQNNVGSSSPMSLSMSRVIRDKILDDAVKRICAEKQDTDKHESKFLHEVYSTSLDKVMDQCNILLKLANKILMSSSPFVIGNTIIGGAILASIDEVSAAMLGSSYFSPGNPDRFVSGYIGALELLKGIESRCCSCDGVLKAFRGSTHYSNILNRFNLQAYFMLRQGEIVKQISGATTSNKEMEAETSTGTNESGKSVTSDTRRLKVLDVALEIELESAKYNLFLDVTSTIYKSLERCWSEDVFLAPLADRFLSLSLQILTRYYNWLTFEIGVDNSVVEQGLPSDESLTTSVSIDDLARICNDVTSLMDILDKFLITKMFERMTPYLAKGSESRDVDDTLNKRDEDGTLEMSDTEMSILISDSFKQLRDRFRALVSMIIKNIMTTTISNRCTDVLRQLRGITATYRMTNKPPPSRPSPYTSSILRPLIDFMNGSGYKNITDRGGEDLKNGVLSRVCYRFYVMTEELIETIKKTESSLRKLKNRGNSVTDDSGTGTNMSDTDKICLQLLLDVKEFAKQAKDKVGIDVENGNEEFSKLWSVVCEKDASDP